MANYMAEVAKMLGVEIGEEFKIKQCYGIFKISDTEGLLWKSLGQNERETRPQELRLVIKKAIDIVKLPWKPKNKEGYYYPRTYEQEVFYALWVGSTLDYAMYNLGMCYRTREEAEEHFAEDYKKLTGEELEQ